MHVLRTKGAAALVAGLVMGVVATLTPQSATALEGDRLGSFPMPEAVAPAHRAGPAEQLVRATATFTADDRIMPAPTDPRHRFVMPGGKLTATIDFGYHWETGKLSYHYSLAADMQDPAGDDDVRTVLGFGKVQEDTCQLEEATYDWVSRYLTGVLLYDNKDTPDLASAADWDCAVLAVDNGDLNTPYDAFVTRLNVVKATPKLRLKAPRKDRLVRGVWTRIPIKIRNRAAEGVDAHNVVVRGAGKGIKVRRVRIGGIDAQRTAEADVWAKLTRPKAKLKLTVTEKGQVMRRAAINLRQRPAPAPPRPGRWSGDDVSFAVRGGKVRGFHIRTQTRCGGYPGPFTYTQNTYNFPTIKIPRNNEVVGSKRGNRGGSAEYVVHLDLTFVSRTKVKGSFAYHGPARCYASDGFTATRRR